ncbi:MAG: GNAT family N-acetyltransferase [Treponema sp.]|jgi:Leu/Phe-tRNA-protein transferase|nr:GNAT family N-acetyltransferase [Treponema sp.]
MYSRYTSQGMILISPRDDPGRLVDFMLETGYAEEFCVALDFDCAFIARLMDAGFLVMSASFGEICILLPKLHLTRSVLFFGDLHVKRSIRRFLPRYELRFDEDFDRILDRCTAIHGEDWLTAPLTAAIRRIRDLSPRALPADDPGGGATTRGGPRPVSFGVYRNGELKAGEFGVVSGRVYTSYSGYYDEDNAGTVQMILAARFLQERGFAFFDLGMPLDYKYDLGAQDVSPRRFVDLFRGKTG